MEFGARHVCIHFGAPDTFVKHITPPTFLLYCSADAAIFDNHKQKKLFSKKQQFVSFYSFKVPSDPVSQGKRYLGPFHKDDHKVKSVLYPFKAGAF